MAARRLVLACGGVAFAATLVAGVLVLLPESSPATTPGPVPLAVARQFLDAVAVGDAARAAALSDDPTAVADALRRARAGMDGARYSARIDAPPAVPPGATGATFPATVTWALRAPAGATWTYPVTVDVRRTDTWRVHWTPATLHPALPAGATPRAEVRSDTSGLLDRAGRPVDDWATKPAILPGLRRVTGAAAGADGWRVTAVDAAGKAGVVLGDQPPTGGRTTTITLDRKMQESADRAVAREKRPAMLVAVRPSTGEVLAVAQNDAVRDGIDPLTGRYPPGSTFKIVTATGVLSSGLAAPDSVVGCPASATIQGRTVRNDGFGYPAIPFHTAFARSCNTTFATLGSALEAGALQESALQLGIGQPLTIPGADASTGDVPVPASPAEAVEDTFGQGRVLVTPFAMARAAGIVASGKAPGPSIVRGSPAESPESRPPPGAAVLGPLRSMMREVVTSGTASALARYGGLAGKTGTAEFTGGAHGWFVGYRGDLAFAVLVVGGGSSAPALALTAPFLDGIR